MDSEKVTRLLSEYTRHGSEGAFRELVEGYAGMVLGVARQRLGSHGQWAEDVAQSTFIALARQASTIPDGSHLGAWLHRVSSRTAVDYLRRETRRQRREEKAFMNDDSLTSHSGSRVTGALDAALDSLKPDERRVISLRFLEGLDFRAVGNAMALSEDACRMRLKRALERLRGKLAAAGVTCSTAALSEALAATPVTGVVTPALVSQWSAAALAGKIATASTTPLWIYVMTTKTKLIATAAVAAILIPTALVLISRHDSPTPGSSSAAASSGGSGTTPGFGSTAASGSGDRRSRSEKAADFKALLGEAIATCNRNPNKDPETEKDIVNSLMVKFAQLPPEMIPAALAEIEGQKDKRTHALIGAALVGIWARMDGPAAMAYAKEKLADLDRVLPLSTPMGEWGKRQPDAAVAWLTDKENNSVLDHTYPGNKNASYYVAQPLLSHLLDAKRFDLIGSLVDKDQFKGQVPFLLLEKLRHTDDPQAIYDGLAELPKEQRIEISKGLGRVLAEERQVDSKGVASWIESIQDPAERAGAALSMAERLIGSSVFDSVNRKEDSSLPVNDSKWTNPADIANWTLKNTPEDQRGAVTGSLVAQWVHYATPENPAALQAAGEWLGAQPQGAGTDPARDAYARKLAETDPAGARQWADTIQDPALKADAIAEIDRLAQGGPSPADIARSQGIEEYWKQYPQDAEWLASSIKNEKLRKETMDKINALKAAKK
ncbi:sigma-70 family RNA polymerase sigma factor [Luteolibacter ambystomatis]|uniref:Sigma-70 family RNA polymerase sigma factor n=1 Tax=Luteolibacter ambystomatis TaxID=2824561 RepID=A0A975PGV7_9BACT|nr:sigma-70 family RNA polymerase sigma factor [Luteolibacter ambystomatis]QUE53123.1 sigma-70 family RNA polymerase sigma factor [Luteolibacter ambystomatis]